MYRLVILLLIIISHVQSSDYIKTVRIEYDSIKENKTVFDNHFQSNDFHWKDSLFFISILDYKIKWEDFHIEERIQTDTSIRTMYRSDILFYDSMNVIGREIDIIEKLLEYNGDKRVCAIPVISYNSPWWGYANLKNKGVELIFEDTNKITSVITYDTIMGWPEAIAGPYKIGKPDCNVNSLQVFALLLINQLYKGRDYAVGDFGPALILVDNKNRRNYECFSGDLVDIAYEYYEKWFQKVKEIGISEARRLNLNPLEGSGIRWY